MVAEWPHEFRQPMSERLTDGEWQRMLAEGRAATTDADFVTRHRVLLFESAMEVLQSQSPVRDPTAPRLSPQIRSS